MRLNSPSNLIIIPHLRRDHENYRNFTSRHGRAVLLASSVASATEVINTVSQFGAFLMPYAWGAARDATGGFEVGLTGLAIAAALAVLVALAARSQARRPRLVLKPA